MARSTLRRTRRRRTNRRRLQRGGEGQRQVEEELMRCKKRVETLEKLLSLFTDGTLTDKQFFDSITRLLQAKEPVPEPMINAGPNSSDQRYFGNLFDEVPVVRASSRSPSASGSQNIPVSASLLGAQESERRSSDNERKMREKKLGVASRKDKLRSEPMVMYKGISGVQRQVPQSAIDRLKYYQDKVANSTPAEIKEFKKNQRKEKRWRTNQAFSGKSKSRYPARA